MCRVQDEEDDTRDVPTILMDVWIPDGDGYEGHYELVKVTVGLDRESS